jgi:hypothetical protein
LADRSDTKAFTSSGEGGKPIKSKFSGLINFCRDADSFGRMPLASSAARMNWSTGVLTQDFAFTGEGSAESTVRNAQCP